MATAVVNDEPIVLLKPETYMNRSGLAVASVMRYRRAQPADLVVALDDADLDFARIRVRARGASGGHRGLDSVIRNLACPEFSRVRVGIGRSVPGEALLEHVLKPFPEELREQADEMIRVAAEAALCIIESGVESAMNLYNGR